MQQSEYLDLSGPLTRDEVKKALNAIFRKIGKKETSAQGLADLYCLTRHPEVDIEPYLTRTPPLFQEYIRRGLASHDADALHERSENGGFITLLLLIHTHARRHAVPATRKSHPGTKGGRAYLAFNGHDRDAQ